MQDSTSCSHGCHHNSDAEERQQYCISIVPLFNHLDLDELKEIVQTTRSHQFPKGQIVYHSGETSEGLYIVHKGSMKIYRLSGNGKEQLIRILGPGDFTGELSLFSASVHESYAEALEPLELCIMSRDSLQSFLLKYPQIALKMLGEFTSRLAESEKQATRIATETVETRIALYLSNLSEMQKNSGITLPMSRKHLASYLGTTPETISRKLADFEASGWISQQGQRQIEIHNLDALLLV
ncbi:Crp/Fnr family transcriptional regulator [Paenibacillus antibioticophila]|uniref:Crp/Fnr family transcriptional regulator n=1 Tax=Paenibacillus antibioticophila TaxID=1274374 RepID=A0A919XU02_9BACL|nr:Crp/Fnr family transcriptional regulator [Paenibacillus antibioticophila]GIO37964.1 Crp/Fnr family transcriptional regulator [Paenibacillus antibioticophila]